MNLVALLGIVNDKGTYYDPANTEGSRQPVQGFALMLSELLAAHTETIRFGFLSVNLAQGEDVVALSISNEQPDGTYGSDWTGEFTVVLSSVDASRLEAMTDMLRSLDRWLENPRDMGTDSQGRFHLETLVKVSAVRERIEGFGKYDCALVYNATWSYTRNEP